jgi:hypothetical protein
VGLLRGKRKMSKFDEDKKPKKLSRRRVIIYLIISFVFGFIILEVVSEIVLFNILGMNAFPRAFPASFTVFTFLSFSSSPLPFLFLYLLLVFLVLIGLESIFPSSDRAEEPLNPKNADCSNLL